MTSPEERDYSSRPRRDRCAQPVVYSAAVLTRTRAFPRLLLLPCLLAVSCAVHGTPRPPLLPMAALWKTMLPDFVEPPLAGDARRIYVATRDQAVRALDQTTGEVAWKVEGLAGRLSAADGTLLVRAEDGTLT